VHARVDAQELAAQRADVRRVRAAGGAVAGGEIVDLLEARLADVADRELSAVEGEAPRVPEAVPPVAAALGANFGWPEYEGLRPYDSSFLGAHPVTFPVQVYTHANGNCAVGGGYVVRDPDLPSLLGRYLYGDFCRGWLRSFIPQVSPPGALDDRLVGPILPDRTTLGQGPGNRIYLAEFSGQVSRLVETP
jgi:hypothetical protein